jgi:hypothetical protein
MFVKRLFSSVVKCPTNYKCGTFCKCDEQIDNIIKQLNIKLVTLTMKQKDDIIIGVQEEKIIKQLDEIKKERCD